MTTFNQLVDQRRVCDRIKRQALFGKRQLTIVEHTFVSKCARHSKPLPEMHRAMLDKINERVG